MSDELPMILDLGTDIAEAAAPEILPTGTYIGEVRQCEPKVSNSGNKYIAVQFYISPDEYPADYDVAEAPDGVILTFNRVPFPEPGDKRGIYRMRKFMEALEAPFEGSKVDLDKWVGLKAALNISHETYEGETRASIKSVTKDI